ncbi:hypothetical protein [Aliarcobacter cryaerophilus]|uniref:hypothetical protein n=1 Tax=Aliarcobacter cryaerophilus TaxID=28198 RepID=UPI0021B28486|nr:hypothetical protein [Aliarcobacter cryaerophilus]MCT7506991.1 hypothetical protein [Aliarcobacter cryaerophilus]
MKYLEKIVEHKSSLVLIFLILSLIVTLFTNIDLLDFTLVFIVAVLFAFYIEYNNSNSKLMVILREYF